MPVFHNQVTTGATTIDRFYMWDEVAGEVGDIAIPPEVVRDKADSEKLIVRCADWLLNGCLLHEYDKREITHVGETTVLRGRFSRNLAFGIYLGDGAEEVARTEFSAFRS